MTKVPRKGFQRHKLHATVNDGLVVCNAGSIWFGVEKNHGFFVGHLNVQMFHHFQGPQYR